VLGVVVFWWLADEPETAYYLTQEEKELMVLRKRRQIGHTETGDEMHKEDVYKAFKDWKVWMFAFVSGQNNLKQVLLTVLRGNLQSTRFFTDIRRSFPQSSTSLETGLQQRFRL
jgi:hypothetical protein